MKVQLLVLLALAGPLCSFTRASPVTVSTEFMKVETATKEETGTIGIPSADPQAVPQDVTISTEEPVATSKAHTDVTNTEPELITETTVEGTGAPAVYTSASAETTLLPAVATVTPAPETTAPEETTSPFPKEPKAPTNPEDPTERVDNDTRVEIEDDLEEGLSTGQIVGIVIGAIMAVVFVIAVVIAVLRRMGKYSP
ncbi:podoplanin [Anableps anableps]